MERSCSLLSNGVFNSSNGYVVEICRLIEKKHHSQATYLGVLGNLPGFLLPRLALACLGLFGLVFAFSFPQRQKQKQNVKIPGNLPWISNTR